METIKDAQDCLAGRRHYDKLSESAKALCQVPIWRAAAYVLFGATKAERAARLARAPHTLRAEIEAAAIKTWAYWQDHPIARQTEIQAAKIRAEKKRA